MGDPVLPACVPPFDTVFFLMLTAFITVVVALRAGSGAMDMTSDPAGRKPISSRTLLLAALYVLLEQAGMPARISCSFAA